MFPKSSMPSDRVAMILRSKTDLSEAEIEALDDRAGWAIIYSTKTKTPRPDPRTQICFTGFSPALKTELMTLAQDAGMHVAKSVTKNLRILCAGDNAGPKKLEKARVQSVSVLSESEFRNLLTTGELPE